MVTEFSFLREIIPLSAIFKVLEYYFVHVNAMRGHWLVCGSQQKAELYRSCYMHVQFNLGCSCRKSEVSNFCGIFVLSI